MSTDSFIMYPSDLQVLDYWTQVSIEAHFKELVKEAQEINNTGETEYNDTGNNESTD